MSNYCEDCGTKLIENMCPNCEEEYFIEKQRLEDEEDVYYLDITQKQTRIMQ